MPLGALVPKGSLNLTVAGRSVSSDRLANSALRVQASCMAMGQAAGAAAALAVRANSTPSDVPLDEIRELATLIRPHLGVVTAVNEAQLAYLGSLETIAEEKGRLVEALPPNTTVLVVSDHGGELLLERGEILPADRRVAAAPERIDVGIVLDQRHGGGRHQRVHLPVGPPGLHVLEDREREHQVAEPVGATAQLPHLYLVATGGTERALLDLLRVIADSGEGLYRRGLTISARATDFLVVRFDRAGRLNVHDRANVRTIDAHAKGVRRDHEISRADSAPRCVERYLWSRFNVAAMGMLVDLGTE